MKVFNLACQAGHGFEGWFGSEADYLDQQARGLLTCPLCGNAQVERRPSAPRLNLSGAREPTSLAMPSSPSPASTAVVSTTSSPVPAAEPTPEARYLQLARQVLAQTEDVGTQFTEEVRRIHYGEAEHRNLRGETTAEQRQELHEEGIEVFSLPIPAALKGPLQ